MGSCAWLAMPRITLRSDELTELLHACGCDLDALPLNVFHLIKQLVHHVRELDLRLCQLEPLCQELQRQVAQLEQAPSQADSIELPAALFDEAFADEREAKEGA